MTTELDLLCDLLDEEVSEDEQENEGEVEKSTATSETSAAEVQRELEVTKVKFALTHIRPLS